MADVKTINELTYKIRGCVFRVYNTLGPGLLESIYEQALLYELKKSGLEARNQVPVDVIYDAHKLKCANLRIDILVEDTIILELKSVEELKPVFFKQLKTYLRLTDKRLGLLINFNVDNIMDKDSIIRIPNNL